LHIYVIEELNAPKMDLISKSDPYVLIPFEKDNVGLKTKALDNRLTPQWNELLNYTITNQNAPLIVEIWGKKDAVKDILISSTKLNIEKYLSENPYFEGKKINKMLLFNLVMQIKPLDDSFISKNEVDSYLSAAVIPNIE